MSVVFCSFLLHFRDGYGIIYKNSEEGLLRWVAEVMRHGRGVLGGCFLQPDVVDDRILLEAQRRPEDYQSLSVRVSGWNAGFVTLNKE